MSADTNLGTVKKRVLLVDDHPVVRTGLAQLINREADLVACGEAENERSALDAAHQLRPDVAVVDWSLKDRDSSGLIASLRQEIPRLPVLVLSIHDELFYAERALRAGADGYCMKLESGSKVIDAIRRVASGQIYLTERAAHAVAADVRKRLRWGQTSVTDDRVLAVAEPITHGEQAARSVAVPKTKIALSIVIPVYNSEATIERLGDLLIRELTPVYRLQIVLVDDGSRDRSGAACRRLHERYPEMVDHVTLSRNFGEHNAVMAGLHLAEGDYCVIMDDDFQNPPEEVAKLVEEIQKGHDVVYVRYEQKRHSWFRNLGSRLHNWMATRALGKPADLYLSSFKAISQFVVREAVHYTGPDPYLDAIILRTSRKIGVVTARHEPRDYGESGYTIAKLTTLWGNMFVAFSLYPLRLLAAFGFIMSVVGVVYGAYTLAAWATPLIKDPDTYQTMNAATWFWRGLTFLAIGILGEYVGRIYMHLTRDPQFIIRDIVRRHPRMVPTPSTPTPNAEAGRVSNEQPPKS